MPSPLVACPCYRDTRAAITFLTEAFGFEAQAVYEDEHGTIVHEELTLGDAMIMLPRPGEGGTGELLSSVAEAGKPTGAFYVVVDDADAHAERARAAGAEILVAPRDRDHGGRDYTCRDPEGHVWTFGTYNPWNSTSA